MLKYVKPEIELVTVKCPDIMAGSNPVGEKIASGEKFDTQAIEPSEVRDFIGLDWDTTIDY